MSLAAALGYARAGIAVFPVNFSSKHPLCEHGFYDASTDEAQIRKWWKLWPLAMIGMPTGQRNGVWVLDVDVDPKKDVDGFQSMARLVAQYGPLPLTRTARTPRGGRHFWFRWQEQFQICSRHDKIAVGIDVRGTGGYCVVPPSAKIDGTRYCWEDETCDIATAPAWLTELALTAKPARRAVVDLNDLDGPPERPLSVRDQVWARAALEAECSNLFGNSGLNRAAFSLGQIVGGGGLSEREVFQALLDAAAAAGLIVDYGEPSVVNTIKSGLGAGRKLPRYRRA
jgi:hypothetical protein